ncbi:NTF2 and RRM domain-containing protein [Podospora didyma]|uniref:NTF2 and RRM domain-containing protein n=1 Tax=Podospora didyma TaxID=330526 RepID=A0AAE0N250_9PEZI|nr:NTF2 and RRM domain-containing protein [Podospora didyma]
MATNGNINHHDQYKSSADQYAAPTTTEAPTNASSGNTHLPKDEVGWYFVEQYYTTLSKSPDKLHLFYGKRSQFVCGPEAEVSNISVGRQDIQERIKQLDFEDAKVRVTNVDSQGSGDQIVIQVIGEMSNKAAEPKKFVQTFVLASQPSGYFVLNDIFRYIDEDIEEDPEAAVQDLSSVTHDAPAPAEAEVEVKPETPVSEELPQAKEPVELDAAIVDQKLEEASSAAQETPPISTSGVLPAELSEDVQEVATPKESVLEMLPEPQQAVEEIAEEEVKKAEEPKDPAPTPAPAPPAPVPRAAAPPAAAQPEKPKEAPKPMTWASRAAAAASAAAAPRPPVALPKAVATPAVPAQPRAPAPAVAQQSAPAPTQAVESTPAAAATKEQDSEWQSVAETNRKARLQATAAGPPEKEGTMAYIKYVTDKVQEEDLKNELLKYGELAYFDINRQKNCAFVEFKSTSGYNNAVAANPHTVNGENILVEQRRPKANAYGGSNYSATRGGAAGRGRGGFEGSRSGQGGGRGGFPGQGRGRGGGLRGGRGASVAGTA